MSSTRRNDPARIERDRYETPGWCIEFMVDKVRKYFDAAAGRDLQIIDVGAGDGRIGKALRRVLPEALVTYVEIDESVCDLSKAGDLEKWEIGDYLRMDLDKLVERRRVLFVGNPPFSAATEIVFKTVDWMKHRWERVAAEPMLAVFLLRMNWLGSERRQPWLEENPPTRLTVLTPRPSFCVRVTRMDDGKMKRSSNDSCEYAWIWWEAHRDGSEFFDVCRWELSKADRKRWYAENRREVDGGWRK